MPARFRLGDWFQHAWNAFTNKEPYIYRDRNEVFYSRPDRVRMRKINEQSIVTAIYNRISLDVAAISVRHVRLDENKAYEEDINSSLNYILTTEANLDQTSRAFMQDVVISLFDEGCVAIVPIEASKDINETGGVDIFTCRTGKIVEWYPDSVKVSVYNEKTGIRENLVMKKKAIAIIENPFYAVMNEPNSVLQRLIRKLNLLDTIDEQSGSGKLDLIIQLPYVVKTDLRRQQAEIRRKDIETQLAGSKYGIAYTDATERITQLNRPAENHLMSQIEYLTSMLFSQLNITEEILNGTADESTMLNYMARCVEPILSAILDECKRKFLTQTARTQRQSIMYFMNIFRLVPANQLANVADKYTRNEILSSNEFRAVLGYRPSKDPSADELRNKNLNPKAEEPDEITQEQMIQIFETLMKNPDAIEQLDPEYKEIVTRVMQAISDKVK